MAATHPGLQGLRRWLRAFWPAPVRVDARERLRSVLGAGIGILFAAAVSRWAAGLGGWPAWLVAPLGASAVLVFAVPASPLAQPWSVVGGNTLSTLVGVACVLAIPDPVAAAAVAVALAIGVMFALRCLHPPGGAAALFAVLGQVASPKFALFPVLVNSVLLVAAGVLYNSLCGRRYPHAQLAPPAPSDEVGRGSRFTSADLDAALAHYNQVLDVSRDDLEDLLAGAEQAAYRRQFGELSCGEIMSRHPVAVEFGTSLSEAWTLMRTHRIKALPVVDRVRRLVGIVTVADFMRGASLDLHEGLADRLRAFVRKVDRTHSDKPEVVGQIMTRQVRVVSENRAVVELVPLFSDAGHHHIPVIDGEQRLVGVITQTDLVRALCRAVQPGAAAAA
ncbi:MAG: HPP family protein [Aquabacterium sp.]|nr:MAG: HPP family protein [Aquabacterium sp.]